jgi:hypothetical protein
MQTPRNQILMLVLIGLFCAGSGAQQPSLVPERNGDSIRVTATQLHFLVGKAEEKLRNGAAVTFVMTMAALLENSKKPAVLVRETFVISYDLWEEKYSVVQRKPGGRSASRIAAATAEAWCLGNIAIPVRSIPERRAFMLRFECSIAEEEAPRNEKDNSTLTLAGLIDVFSRKKREEPLHWEAVAGPFRLEELK